LIDRYFNLGEKLTKVFEATDEWGYPCELYQHEGRPSIKCDCCDDKIKDGDYYTVADAGEKYCEDCFTE
jgi:hypothetical protein